MVRCTIMTCDHFLPNWPRVSQARWEITHHAIGDSLYLYGNRFHLVDCKHFSILCCPEEETVFHCWSPHRCYLYPWSALLCPSILGCISNLLFTQKVEQFKSFLGLFSGLGCLLFWTIIHHFTDHVLRGPLFGHGASAFLQNESTKPVRTYSHCN